jgi:hypothetical protein
MRVSARHWLTAAFSLIFFIFTANAQTRFVQITDPHIFDADQPSRGEVLDKNEKRQRVSDARRAFLLALQEIDHQIKKGANYEFVVITGDFGVAHWSRPVSDAAKIMAQLLKGSKIKQFLFVPGNNDVGNSLESIDKYFDFIRSLKQLLPDRVVDLCEQHVLDKDGRLFIGFNNASYGKDNEKHLSELKLLRERIRATDKPVSRVYIFFHIAGIDDPHLVETKHPNAKQPDYPYSAWVIDNSVRQMWHELLSDPVIKGVFTGHFHAFRRNYYQKPFSWMLGSYPKDFVEKTYLCPPISGKYQWSKPSRARGYQVVTLDAEGKPSAEVFWYENGRFLTN